MLDTMRARYPILRQTLEIFRPPPAGPTDLAVQGEDPQTRGRTTGTIMPCHQIVRVIEIIMQGKYTLSSLPSYWRKGRRTRLNHIFSLPSPLAVESPSSLPHVSSNSLCTKNLTLANLFPVCTQCRPPALCIALDHCAFGIVTSIPIDFRKEVLESRVSPFILETALAKSIEHCPTGVTGAQREL